MRTLLLAVAPQVARAVRRVLGRSHPEVEDVAQQALAALVERLPLFRGESSVAHFAERIAVYRALTARRNAGVRRRFAAELMPPDIVSVATDDAVSPFAGAVGQARRALLLEALDALPPAQAEALVLHFLFDHTVAEIAAMIGAPDETVRSRLRLGKQALRAKIERDVRLGALREGIL
jgi:RNA polymerase sigma-70 factor (ECF subfamily)